MFDRQTVFILGAGASWHYGYPTGEDLVSRVIQKAEQLAKFFELGGRQSSGHIPDYASRNDANKTTSNFMTLWMNARDDASQLAARLKEVNPTLIDYFLAQNSDLHDVGRLTIALVIFDCEWEYVENSGNQNHLYQYQRRAGQGLVSRNVQMDFGAFKDDWLRFVLYKLTARCAIPSTLSSNNVKFVTFNYDTSLERRLFLGLSNISHFKPPDISAFMEGDRFFHVYGALRERVDKDSKPTSPDLATVFGPGFQRSVTMLNEVYKASLGIRTIDGDDKVKNECVISAAQAAIKAAEVVYILGFGFDTQNTSRVRMTMLGTDNPQSKTVFFTNFGGHNRVSKAAGKVLINSAKYFVEDSPFYSAGFSRGEVNSDFRYEMSVKNVYDAIAEDFDSMEEL
jgi:hypothetical protein